MNRSEKGKMAQVIAMPSRHDIFCVIYTDHAFCEDHSSVAHCADRVAIFFSKRESKEPEYARS